MQEDEIEDFFETFNEKPTSYALVSYINKENEVRAVVLDMIYAEKTGGFNLVN